MADQLLKLDGMQMPQSSPQKNKSNSCTNDPCSGPQPDVLYGASSQADAMRQPIIPKSLRTRFNPQLIGFGVIGVPVLDSYQHEHSAHVSAVGIFFGKNPGGQK